MPSRRSPTSHGIAPFRETLHISENSWVFQKHVLWTFQKTKSPIPEKHFRKRWPISENACPVTPTQAKQYLWARSTGKRSVLAKPHDRFPVDLLARSTGKRSGLAKPHFPGRSGLGQCRDRFPVDLWARSASVTPMIVFPLTSGGGQRENDQAWPSLISPDDLAWPSP